MTRPLTFREAYDQAAAVGVTMVKYAGSSNAYGSVFRCKNGHEWSGRHNNVVSSNKTGCPVCYSRSRHMTEQDVAEKLLQQGRELVSIDSDIRGQKTLVTVKCDNGHVNQVRLGTIIYAKKACPDCSKAARGCDIDAYNRRLEELGYHIIFGEKTGENATLGCKCGHQWETRLGSVLRGDSHCPACFEKGFDGSKPAVLYLYAMRQGKKLRYGYGISGQFKRRNAEHLRNAAAAGWKLSLEKVWEFDRGVVAQQLESKLKVTFPVPSDVPKGFKTEAIMPRYLSQLLATLTNSDIVTPSQDQRKGQSSS